jgi:hypothetical protein
VSTVSWPIFACTVASFPETLGTLRYRGSEGEDAGDARDGMRVLGGKPKQSTIRLSLGWACGGAHWRDSAAHSPQDT